MLLLLYMCNDFKCIRYNMCSIVHVNTRYATSSLTYAIRDAGYVMSRAQYFILTGLRVRREWRASL